MLPVKSESLLSIQSLRFFAAIMVVIHHAVNTLHDKAGFSGANWLLDFFYFGASGVQIFFIISGFVMVYASSGLFEKKGAWKKFLYRRIIRIYPIYIFCVVLNIAIRSTIGDVPYSDPISLVWTMALLPGYASNVIIPAWTLSYEMYFYIIFAVVLLLPARFALAAITLFFMACVAMRHFIAGGSLSEFSIMATNPILIDFVVGAWIGYFVKNYGLPRVPKFALISILILSIAALLFNFTFARHVPYMVSFGIPSVLIVFSLVSIERRGMWTSTFKRFSSLGDASYSLYLVHQLVLTMIFQWSSAGTAVEFFVWVSIMISASLACGLAMYRYVEIPLLKMLRRSSPVRPVAT